MAQDSTSTPALNDLIAETESLRGEAEALQLRVEALAERIRVSGPQSAGYGAATDAITDEAAVLVDRRRDQEFAAAPFDGENIRAQGTLQRTVTNLRFTLEGVTKACVSFQSGATSLLGNTLRLVVDTTRSAVTHPFTTDPGALRAAGLPLLRRVDAYQESIQSKRGQNDQFRAAIAEVQADNQRLAAELSAERRVIPAPAAPPAAAPRRARRSRR